MRPLIVRLTLLLALLQWGGVAAAVAAPLCDEGHHEDHEEGADEGCPPECAACPCCTHAPVAPTASRPVAVPDSDLSSQVDLVPTSSLLSPPPGDVFHVPR